MSHSQKRGEPEPKSQRRDPTTPDLMIVDDDDDEPLPNKPIGMRKKLRVYSQEELGTLDTLLLRLKSEAQTIQYGLETAGLTQYHNDHVPGLRGARNMDDHSAYLSNIKKESWSYLAKGNLVTVRQFFRELKDCGDPDKDPPGRETLWDKGMPGIHQDNTPKGEKWELIKARYVMRVQQSIEGELIDTNHPDYGREQNIVLYDIVSPASMRKV